MHLGKDSKLCHWGLANSQHTCSHTYPLYGLSLIVKVGALAACSPPGSVCLYWISCYVLDEMAYHLHLILCTPSAATACTPVTHFFPLGVQLCSLHPKWEGKNYSMNEWMNEWMNEKPPKCMCMPNVLACLSKPERTYWSLTPQLGTVIIEESSFKVLSLRCNPWRLYKAKHLPSWNGTYSDTGFYSVQTTYLSMRTYDLFLNHR